MNLCKCRCGQKVAKEGNKFIIGHNKRTNKYELMQQHNFIPCKCLCGTLIPEYDSCGRKKRFVYGHSSRGIYNPNYGKTPSDATKQKMSITRKKMKFSDKHRKNLSKSLSGENNPMYGKTHSPETKQKMSKNHPDNSGKNNPMFGRCGNLNPNWKGGVSKEPYCYIWSPWLKEEIKERDNFKCQNPDCIKEITKTNQLCIHHTDYNKKNCSANNLITLCRSCNAKANFNREYWKKFYNNILMETK